MRTRRGRAGLLGILVLALGLGACGGDDDSGDGNGAAAEGSGGETAAVASISEENLPEGFEKTPTVEQDGKEWRFDDVPGHYWKVLDERGYAVGLHFQSDKPFKWAEDVPKGELLYIVYAIPGNCGNGSFESASKAQNASIVGPLPAGFDHWHGLVGAGPKSGHWLMHTAVRDFTLAGPPGNPMAGTQVEAGQPGFMPVCDIR
jgi:hypothetical protein